MDLCSGIQQNTVANGRTVLDTGILQYHTTASQLSVWTDVGTGSNDVGERIVKCFCFLIHLCPKPVIADAHHQQVIVFPQLPQISKTINHRNATDFAPHRLSIIHKGTVVLEHRLLRHHTAKSTSTDQQEFFLRH